MNEQEVTCLRCGSIEIDCECTLGFQANPYDRIAELTDRITELEDQYEEFSNKAIEVERSCRLYTSDAAYE